MAPCPQVNTTEPAFDPIISSALLTTSRPFTATPAPRQTPTAHPTATPPPPTATPTPVVPLELTTSANLWIYIQQESNFGYTEWEVYADPAFDVDAFDLDVFIDGRKFCNPNPIYGDLSAGQLSCESYEPRRLVPEVYATVGGGLFRDPRVLVCAKNQASNATRLVYACNWR